MGYKVKIQTLEGLKKTLEDNNELLRSLCLSEEAIGSVIKQIQKNDEQIKLLKEGYYID